MLLRMEVRATTDAPLATPADTIAVGVFEDEGVAHDVDGVLQGLVDSGEAKRALKKLAVTHAEGRRWIVAGLGPRDGSTLRRARTSPDACSPGPASSAPKRLCWELPHHVSDTHAAPSSRAALMGAYEFTMFKSGADDDDGPSSPS